MEPDPFSSPDLMDFLPPLPAGDGWYDDLAVLCLIVSFVLIHALTRRALRRRRSRRLAAEMNGIIEILGAELRWVGARSIQASWRDSSPSFSIAVRFDEGTVTLTCRRGVTVEALVAAVVEAWRSGIAAQAGSVEDEPFVEDRREGEAPSEPAVVNRAWWQVLGVRKDAGYREVRVAYRDLAMVHHPDQGGSADRMIEINAAMEAARAELKGKGP